MNGFNWIAQLLLAGIFLFAGASKLLAYRHVVKLLESRPRRKEILLPRWQGTLIGLLEVGAAFALVIPTPWLPFALAQHHLLVCLASAGLGLLMVAAAIYHIRRKEPSAPEWTLFLLALLVFYARWTQ
jgi:pilus assembly protein TadC